MSYANSGKKTTAKPKNGSQPGSPNNLHLHRNINLLRQLVDSHHKEKLDLIPQEFIKERTKTMSDGPKEFMTVAEMEANQARIAREVMHKEMNAAEERRRKIEQDRQEGLKIVQEKYTDLTEKADPQLLSKIYNLVSGDPNLSEKDKIVRAADTYQELDQYLTSRQQAQQAKNAPLAGGYHQASSVGGGGNSYASNRSADIPVIQPLPDKWEQGMKEFEERRAAFFKR